MPDGTTKKGPPRKQRRVTGAEAAGPASSPSLRQLQAQLQAKRSEAELWGNMEDTDSDSSVGFEVTKVVNMEDTNSDSGAGFEVTKVVLPNSGLKSESW